MPIGFIIVIYFALYQTGDKDVILILYVPVNHFSVMLDRSSWVEPVLGKNKCVLLKDTTQ